jgi:hypothetical protein
VSGRGPAAQAAAALLAAACGYAAGLDLRGEGVRTVAVAVAANDSFRQRLEIPLTRALLELLPIHTGLQPAAESTADARLEVHILDIRGRSLVQGVQDPVREGSLDFRVRARLVERASGRTLRDRTIVDRAEFRAPVGEDERSAARESARDLARKIVLALEPDF